MVGQRAERCNSEIEFDFLASLSFSFLILARDETDTRNEFGSFFVLVFTYYLLTL